MRKKVNFLAIFAAAMLCAMIVIPTKSHNSIEQALTDTIGVTTVQAEGTDIASGTWGTCPWTIDANGVLTIGAGTGADASAPISDWRLYKAQITAVKESGTVVLPNNSSYLFYGLEKAKTIDVSKLNTQSVTSFGWMFSECKSLTKLDVSKFDTHNATNMSNMFSGCKSLTELDVSKFDTHNATNMSNMFSECKSLTKLDVSKFDTHNAINMSNMFFGCKSLTELDVSKFDTQKVTSMDEMFTWCSSLTALNLSNFDTQNVTDMRLMFSSCSSLTALDVSKFNTQNVTDMYAMFSNCSSLTALNLSNFDTQNVTYMNAMFEGCSSLESIDLSSFNTAAVTSMYEMFEDCSSLTALNLSNFDTQNVTDKGMYRMFRGCANLKNLNVSSFSTAKVETMYEMFKDCSSLTALNLSNFDTQNVTDMEYMFEGCSSLESIDLSSFNTAAVTSMYEMFKDCSSLTALNLSNFDTQNVTDMHAMFSGCSSLTALDASKFNTQSVTDMAYMFEGCSSLAALDVSKFNTQSVTDMRYMFDNCASLASLDLSSFDTQKVWSMQNMLTNCDNLRKITFGDKFKVKSAVVLSTPMFTASNVVSNGKWGLGSETANVSYTPQELISQADTVGKISGEWYAQKASDETTLSYSVLDSSGILFFIRSADIVRASKQGTVKSIDGDSYTGVIYPNVEIADFKESPLPGSSADKSAIKAVKVIDEIHPTSASYMFSGLKNCVSMDLAKLDTSNVTNMSHMFDGCAALATLDLSSLDTQKVISMGSMFENCASLESVNVGNFDTSTVQNMQSMFYGCKTLREVDLASFDTQSVRHMDNMLVNCTNLRKMTFGPNFVIPGSSSSSGGGGEHVLYKISAVASSGEYSQGAIFTTPILTVSDLKSNGKWGLGSEENGSPAYTATNLATIGKTAGALNGVWYAQGKSTDASEAYAVIDGNGNMYFIRSTAAVTTGVPNTTVTSISGGTYTGTVYGNIESDDSSVSVPDWLLDSDGNAMDARTDVKHVQFVDDIHPYSTSLWFVRFTNCESMDLAKLDTAKVGNMSGMFGYCSSLTSLDLSSFDTRSVTDMQFMFYGCDNLAKITFGSTFVVPSSMSGEGLDSIFPTPAKTTSGAESTGSWGFGAVKSTSSILTASELATTGETEGALTGTWYAQRKPFVIVLGKYGEQPDVDGNVATVTVNNLKDGSTVKLYQVVDGYYENDKLVRYVLTDPDNGVIAAIGDSTKGQTEGQNDIITEGELTTIANNIQSGAFAYSDDGIDMTVSGTSATADVEPGMYIVIATDPSGETVYNPAVVAVNITDVNSGVVEGGTVDMNTFFQHTDGSDTTVAYLKVSKSDANAEISGSSKADSTDVITPKSAYGDVVSAGDTVHFTLNQMTIPSFSETYTAPQYIITSTPDDSFDAYTNLKVSVGGTDITGDTSKYTVEANGKGFKINFASDYLSSLRGTENTARAVVVTYDAVLSNPTNAFAENHTRTTVQYSNDSADATALRTITKDAYHYTLGIDTSIDSEGNGKVANTFVKVKPDGSVGTDGTIANALSGATFTLYSDEGCTNIVKTIAQPNGTAVSDENGRIVFTGLDEGTYYLKETKAPLGYGLSDQTFRFTLTTELNTSGAMTKYTITKAYKDALHPDWTDAGTDTYTAQASDDGTTQGIVTADDGSITYNIARAETPTVIVNSRLQIMPATGGQGIKLMVLAAALAGISGYAVRRKHEAE